MAVNPVLLEEYRRLEPVRVQSSNIESIGYVPDFARLWVTFLPRFGQKYRVYVYYKVPPAVYAGFLAAGSKGKYLDQVIKKGFYGYEGVL